MLLVESLVRPVRGAGYLMFVRATPECADIDPAAMRCRRRRLMREHVERLVGASGLQRTGRPGPTANARKAWRAEWSIARAGASRTPRCEYFIRGFPDERRAVVESPIPNTAMPCGCSTSSADAIAVHRRPAQSHFPVWAPDGRTVLFDSERWHGRCWRAVNGRAQRGLLKPTANSLRSTGADGRFILYQPRAFHRFDIGPCRFAPRGKPFPSQHARNGGSGSFHPRRWVAYSSDANGRDEVWCRRFPTRRTVVVLDDGRSQPQWRRDGRAVLISTIAS